MSKNPKNKNAEPEPDTESSSNTTDTNSEKDIENKKLNKKFAFSKKAKLYVAMVVVLLVIGGYLWYRNRKNKGVVQENNGLAQTTNVVPSASVPTQSVVLTQPIQDF
jgi:hypothetical protein